MTRNQTVFNVKTPGDLTTAPLANVSLCYRTLGRAIDRPTHLPGLVCFYGPSGFGKSTAATYTALKHRAYYIECKSTWTRKAVLTAILQVMGVEPAKTNYEMADQVCEQLASSERPLIVDEMDHIVAKGAVEVLRDIYEGSGAAILIIGEERLPMKLKRWERFHGRILDWVPAQPADLEDCGHLAKLYCPDVEIEEGLLQKINTVSRGSVRRVCVNLELVQNEALGLGIVAIGLKEWGNRELYTGEAPARRLP